MVNIALWQGKLANYLGLLPAPYYDSTEELLREFLFASNDSNCCKTCFST